MNNIQLTSLYPAAGKSSNEIAITAINNTQREYVWVGKAFSPITGVEEEFMIYQLQLNDGNIDYRAVPAKCPHQGANISNEKVHQDGNVYCSLHRRPICLYSEYNNAYAVIKRNGVFYIAKSA